MTVGAAEDADAANGTATIPVSSAGLTNVDVTANEVDNDTQALVVIADDAVGERRRDEHVHGQAGGPAR